MRSTRNAFHIAKLASPGKSTNQRRHGRVVCDLLTCGLGRVIDFSASGMRVLYRGISALEVGQVVELRLQGVQVSQLLMARIVRAEKAGFWRWQIGLEFIEVTPQITAALTVLACEVADSLNTGDRGGQ